MSRIEEALQKLQARSPRPAAPTPRLATLEPRQHAYAGRRIIVDPAQLRANGLLALDSEVAKRLSLTDLDACFDDAAHLRHVPAVIARLDSLEAETHAAR